MPNLFFALRGILECFAVLARLEDSHFMQPQMTFWRNLRDLPHALTLSGFVAGFLVVLVGYTGPLLIVIQAAEAGGLTQAQTSSWVWAIAVGNGLLTSLLSLLYRQPITSPWSTAGAALLVTSISAYTLPEVIGAFILSNLAIAILGVSGLFGRAMALIPQPIVLGMLAGILLKFGVGVFAALPERPLMVVMMILTFFLLRRAAFRAPTLGVLIVGLVIAALRGELHINGVEVGLTLPVLTLPVFSVSTVFSLALPLFVLAITSQYATGQAVLQTFGYRAPINGILTITGLASMVLALFGGHGQTLGALTAAMITTPEVQPDITKRYSAAVSSGVWYVIFGLFGATIVSLFAAFPASLVATVAGLALSGAIASSLVGALAEPDTRDAALVAFLCTAADFSLFGIGSPFWGLVAGVAVFIVLRRPSHSE